MSNIHGFSDYPPKDNARSGQYIVRSESGISNSGPIALEISNNNVHPPQNHNTSTQSRPVNNCINFLFPKFNWRTFTFAITIIQIIVFIGTIISESRLLETPSTWTCVLYRSGANYTPAINVYKHFHRLILPIFLHGGWLHLFFNLLTQLMYGFTLENFYGVKKFAFLYFISGIGGNLLTSASHSHGNVSIGASSSLFGIFALQLAYLIQHYKELGPRRNFIIGMMVGILIINLAVFGGNFNIDRTAHIGGFIVGGMLSFLYFDRIKDFRFWVLKIVVTVLLVAYFIITFVVIMTFKNLEADANSLSTVCDMIYSAS